MTPPTCLCLSWRGTTCFHTASFCLAVEMLSKLSTSKDTSWKLNSSVLADLPTDGICTAWQALHSIGRHADANTLTVSGRCCTALGSQHQKRHKIVCAVSFYWLELSPVNWILINEQLSHLHQCITGALSTSLTLLEIVHLIYNSSFSTLPW